VSARGDRVLDRVAEVLRRPRTMVSMDTELSQLAADSFVLVELVLELQDVFRVRFDHDDVQGLRTVGDVVDLVEARAAR
jgi:acyl carrier protein